MFGHATTGRLTYRIVLGKWEEKRKRSRYAGKYYDWIYDKRLERFLINGRSSRKILADEPDNLIETTKATRQKYRRLAIFWNYWKEILEEKIFWHIIGGNRIHQLLVFLTGKAPRMSEMIGWGTRPWRRGGGKIAALEENLDNWFWLWHEQ
jgi:hypothetical protein